MDGENVIGTIKDLVSGTSLTEDQLNELITETPVGMKLGGFYSDAELTKSYDFSSSIVSGENIVYIKWISATNLETESFNFDNIPDDTNWNTNVKLGDYITLVNSSSKKFTKDESKKDITNALGEKYTTTYRLKTGGVSDDSGKYIEIDLSNFSGYVYIEVWAITGSSKEARTGQIRKGSVSSESIQTINCPAGTEVTSTKVLVSCGSKYYITADASINYYGINIIKDTTVRTNTTWSFRTDTTTGNEISTIVQSTTETLADGKLVVDATTGKFSPRNQQWAQLNATTKLTFKVAKGATVTINCYNNGYTVNGNAATDKTTTYTATEDTTIEVVATENTYIDSIVITYAE